MFEPFYSKTRPFSEVNDQVLRRLKGFYVGGGLGRADWETSELGGGRGPTPKPFADGIAPASEGVKWGR